MKINLLAEYNKLADQQKVNLLTKTKSLVNLTDNNLVRAHVRSNSALQHPLIKEGMGEVKSRLNGKKWRAEDFGRIMQVPLGKMLFNVDIQRELDPGHIGTNILPTFDPRIAQPVNCIYYKDKDVYTSWEGQHTVCTVLALISYGFIECESWEDFPIICKVVDSDLEPPGTLVSGAEALSNMAFRTINGPKARKRVDNFYVFRSEWRGAKAYNSPLREDVHSMQMWETLTKNGMFPARDNSESKLPGHISHISGMKKTAKHDTEKFNLPVFEETIQFLSKHFSEDSGINSSFYMVIAELFETLHEQGISQGTNEDQFDTDSFAEFLKAKYGRSDTSHEFRRVASYRYKKSREQQGFKTNEWKDECGLPYMLDDYLQYCKKNKLVPMNLPRPEQMYAYVGNLL